MHRDSEHHERSLEMEDEKVRCQEDRRLREEQKSEDRERKEEKILLSDRIHTLMVSVMVQSENNVSKLTSLSIFNHPSRQFQPRASPNSPR